MTSQHHIAAILPCRDIAASRAFYERLGLQVEADYGEYLLMGDGKGWFVHLNQADLSWMAPDGNPVGIYVYVDNVDGVADRVRELIIERHGPERKPWNCYEFSVSDPDGVLVRIGRALG